MRCRSDSSRSAGPRFVRSLCVLSVVMLGGCFGDDFALGELGIVGYQMFLASSDECATGCKPTDVQPGYSLRYLVDGAQPGATFVTTDESVVRVDRVSYNGDGYHTVQISTRQVGEAHIQVWEGDSLVDLLPVVVSLEGIPR